jgi:non-specific serine/threonine protein kinase/serine/threonine-protein kinase
LAGEDDPTIHDPQASLETSNLAPPPANLSPNIDGQRFGAYQVIREIGRGGMGAVYLAARADDQYKKRVALKILRADVNAQEVLSRFRHERQILASFDHPNIAGLLDGGSTPNGEPYFVMDYVEGTPIDQYCDSHGLTVAERITLFRQVCSAVQYVHQNLIVHRDLKPSNILVTADGVPKLLDFGIAKILKPEMMAEMVDATRADDRVMTPAYASPEQVRGEPITTASDIYSLGVVLFEIFTGRRPYRVKADTAHELARVICDEEPDKPSTAIMKTDRGTAQTSARVEELSRKRSTEPDRLERRLKGDLDNILLKAMRKEPQRRYASVEQFSEDLHRHLANLPVSAHEDSLRYRTEKFVRRNIVAVAAGAIAVLSLLAGLIFTTIAFRQARNDRALAESRFEDVRKLAHTFLFDVHDAIQNLSGSTPARALIANTGTEYLDRLASAPISNVRLRDSLQQELAEGYVKIGDVEGNPFVSNLGDIAKALESYRKALALGTALLERNPKNVEALRELARIHQKLGSVLPFAGRASEALNEANESVRLYSQVLVANPDDVQAKVELSGAYEAQGDVAGGAQAINLGRKKEAVVSYNHGLEILPDVPPSHKLAARITRGRIIFNMKLTDLTAYENPSASLPKFREIYAAAQELSRAYPTDSSARNLAGLVLDKIANAQSLLGDTKGALDSYRQGIEPAEQDLRADPTNGRAQYNVMVGYKNLGDVYYYQTKDMAEALKCFRRAEELLEALIQSDPKNVVNRQRLAETISYIASAELSTGKPVEARRDARRSLQIAKEVADLPDANHDQIYNYAWLAVTTDPADLRDPKSALPYAKRAVATGGMHDELSLHVLAQAYAGVGDYAQAVEAEQKALAQYAPLKPGDPIPVQQKMMEDYLKEIRAELKKRASAN